MDPRGRAGRWHNCFSSSQWHNSVTKMFDDFFFDIFLIFGNFDFFSKIFEIFFQPNSLHIFRMLFASRLGFGWYWKRKYMTLYYTLLEIYNYQIGRNPCNHVAGSSVFLNIFVYTSVDSFKIFCVQSRTQMFTPLFKRVLGVREWLFLC